MQSNIKNMQSDILKTCSLIDKIIWPQRFGIQFILLTQLEFDKKGKRRSELNSKYKLTIFIL